MTRFVLILCAGLLLVCPARPGNSTAYIPVPFSTITPFNTSTWQPGEVIPAASANTFVLSADGATIYAVEHSSVVGCAPGCTLGHVLEIDRTTGKTLHSFQTRYPIWGGLAVLPNQSQIYVDTCSSTMDGFTCQGGTVEVLDVASGQDLAFIPMAGDQISQIVASPDGTAVYVTHYGNDPPCNACFVRAAASQTGPSASGALTLIDVATLQVKGSYNPEGYGGGAFALSPDGHKGYLLATYIFMEVGGNGGVIYEIDLAQMSLAATLSTASFCGFGSMGVSPDGARLAVASDCGYPYSNGLMFFDTATGLLTQTVANESGTVMQVTSAGDAYIQNGEIDIVNATTGNVTAELTERSIGAAAFLPGGTQIYLLSASASAVEALQSAATPKLLNIGSPPMWLAVSPDGQTLYSAAYIGGLWAISTSTGQVVWQTLQGVNWLSAVAASPDGQTLYVVEYQPNALIIVDAATGAVENTLPLPGICYGQNPGEAIAITPSGNQVFAMACGFAWMIDTKTQTVIGTTQRSEGAAVAVNPSGTAVYISTGSAIEIVDPTTDKFTGTIPISASAIAFSPDGTKAYVMSTLNGQSGVAVVDTSALAVSGFVPGISPFGACGEHGCSGEGAGEGLAVASDGQLVFAAGTPGAIIDAQTLTIEQQVQFGGPVVVH